MGTGIVIQLFLMLGSLGGVNLQDTRTLILQALDEPTAIALDNVRLTDAIGVLTAQTGVRIFMPPESMKLTPNGGETLVRRVDIANVPLRQGLAELFSPLGMTFEVEDDHVLVIPREALLCLGRAPTWRELETLSRLTDLQPGIRSQDLATLQTLVQFQVPGADAWTMLTDSIRNVGVGAGDEAMTLACDHLGWAWCISDDRIVVAPMERQLQRMLQAPVTLRMNNRPLIEILQELSDKTNVSIRTEPGALASLPPAMQQNFSVNVHNETAENVLERIVAHTGLGYWIGPDGVRVFQARPQEAGSSSSKPGSDPYMAKIIVHLDEGRTFEWLVRSSELPPDLKQMRERELQEFFEAVRQMDRQGKK